MMATTAQGLPRTNTMAGLTPPDAKSRRKWIMSLVALVVFMGTAMRNTNSVNYETQDSQQGGVFRSSSRQQTMQQQQRMLETENLGFDSQQENSEEQQRQEQEEQERVLYGSGPRIGVFGESDSWGAGLSSKFEAYPYHLASSTKITNYAFYNAGPNYASVCTETLVGDDTMLDVIVLEHYLRAAEGLVDLTRRLKARYPQATFIFVKLWKPWMIYRKSSLEQIENGERFDEWTTRLQLPKGQPGQTLYTPELYDALKNDDASLWHMPVDYNAEAAFKQAMDVVGPEKGHLVTLHMDKDNVQQTLLDQLQDYDSLYGLLNPHVHNYIAYQIDEVLTKHPITEDDSANAPIGTWGNGDSCHLWFETGSCPFTHSDAFQMAQHSQDMEGNYVLELSNDGEEGVIEIDNPFETERRLFLSYITSDGESHPKTQVMFAGKETIIDPQSAVDPKKVHPIKTTPVTNLVGPGSYKLKFRSLDTSTKYGFRLVGLSWTDEVSVPLLHEFSPLMEIKFR